MMQLNARMDMRILKNLLLLPALLAESAEGAASKFPQLLPPPQPQPPSCLPVKIKQETLQGTINALKSQTDLLNVRLVMALTPLIIHIQVLPARLILH